MRSGFIILLLLVALGPVVAGDCNTAQDVDGDCNTAPDVDGCPVKVNGWDLPPFFRNIFEPDCNKHKICYSCGAYYGVSRRSCDSRLYGNNKKSMLYPFKRKP